MDANNTNIKLIFKNRTPFTDCMSEINNTQADNAKDINIVMPVYNLIKYSDNCSKTSGSLWQYYRDKPAVNTGNITEFNTNDATTDSLKPKEKIKDEQVIMAQKMLK